MGKLISFVVFLALCILNTNAQTYNFQIVPQPVELDEGPNAVNAVMILRAGTTAELAQQTTTTVSTECPDKVTATASAADYTISSTTITFPQNNNAQPVMVTIVDDSDEEFREFFCLTITDSPGSPATMKVYIKGSDYCINVNSVAETTSTNVDQPGDANTAYIGPWLVGVSGIPTEINFDITPEITTGAAGTAQDLYIFLTQNADKNSIGDYYALYLDDTAALSTHSTAATPAAAIGDSIINKNAVNTVVDGGYLNDANVGSPAIADVVAGSDNSFTLEYVETSATDTITLTDTGRTRTYTANDPASRVDVSNIFVASGNNEFASWKFCGLLPRKLPIVGASSVAYLGAYSPNNAFDGQRGPTLVEGCFISTSLVDPWIQVDLGREFHVMTVLIWPADMVTTISDRTRLNNAKIYVGSCTSSPFSSITSNHECGTITGVAAATSPIEIKCNTNVNTYGRYVYVVQDTTSAVQFDLCEIEVYGDDIPIGNEAVVQFSSATFQTVNDESAQTVAVMATRTGVGLTCTSVDFYTDPSTGGDYTAVSSSSPSMLQWSKTDATGTSKTVNVNINNDAVCEDNEEFNVYLTNVVGGTLGEQSCSAVTINDDDSVVYAFSSPTFMANEGSPVEISVTRTGTGIMQAGTVAFTFTNVDTESNDYTTTGVMVSFTASGAGAASPQTTNIVTQDDNEYEGDETFTLALGALTPTCSTKGTVQTATVTIVDNDSKFKFDTTSGSLTISEGTPSTPVTITRTGDAQQKTVNVDVSTISATSVTDFNLGSTSVTFQQSDTSEQIIINVVDDSIVENDETFTLTLRDPLYSSGSKNLEQYYRLIVTITNNDATYSWKQASYTTTEGAGILEVSIIRSGDTSTAKTIQVTSTSGTATSGTDFTPLSQVVFLANSAEAIANIPISNNNDVENDETFTITIVSGQQDVEIGATQTTTISIVDDDNEVAWQSSTYSFNENTISNQVTLTKTGSGEVTVTVTSQQGTAMQGVDYEPISTQLTFSGSTQTLTVTLINDNNRDPDETFTLTVSGSSITSSTTTITIVDDDEDEGLSAGAIAGITIAAIVGAIAIVAGVVIAYTMLSGGSAAGAASQTATQAQRAAAQRAVRTTALQTFPQNNFSGLNGLGNTGFNNLGNSGLTTFNSGLYSPYGNGLGNQGFGTGLNNQGFGGIYSL